MRHLLDKLKKSLLVIFTLSMTLMFPVSLSTPTFADDAPKCVAPSASTSGVHWPTGSDAGTFTYQCNGPYAGMWTNNYYVYDPATSSRTALYTVTYTYNTATGMWDYNSWDFNAATGKYQLDTLSVSQPPSGANTVGGPAPVTAASPSGSNTGASAGSTLNSTSNGPTTSPSSSPSGGVSSLNTSGTLNTTLNNNTGARMSNYIIASAGSGNAAVIGNTKGGDATTGSAQDIANVINMLQSSSNILGTPNMVTFTANINGDVNGDLLLDPSKLGTIQPANTSTSLDNNVTVNNSQDSSINNTINLNSKSGDATVSSNTKGGNATTGSADAVANIVNILNSAVTAGQSFVGVININGNLNGDILLPPNFIDTLLASNVPRYNVNTSTIHNDVNVTNTNNQSINNDVTTKAASGSATVSGNTSGGNATSGLTNTNLTVFNLTGSNVVASNDLLVFVNVLGKWYGMIFNSPAGTTAASLGGGVTSNTTVNNNAALDNTNNQSINNDIKVASQSGDATVADNTSGGNAKTGKATSSVNLMNMISDSLSLNGWFGLLFINVFGTWNGSFGINTSAGNPAVPFSAGGSSSAPSETFRFVPASTVPGGSAVHGYQPSINTSSGTNGSGSSSGGVVLASKTLTRSPHSPTVTKPNTTQKVTNRFILPAMGVTLAFLILLAGERKRLFGRQ